MFFTTGRFICPLARTEVQNIHSWTEPVVKDQIWFWRTAAVPSLMRNQTFRRLKRSAPTTFSCSQESVMFGGRSSALMRPMRRGREEEWAGWDWQFRALVWDQSVWHFSRPGDAERSPTSTEHEGVNGPIPAERSSAFHLISVFVHRTTTCCSGLFWDQWSERASHRI